MNNRNKQDILMNKKEDFINRLLDNVRSLERSIVSAKEDDSLSFTFFKESFKKSQEITTLIHELEMLQIEDMKKQMEKLINFLSENDYKNSSTKDVEPDSEPTIQSLPVDIPTLAEQPIQEKEEEKLEEVEQKQDIVNDISAKGNKYAEGIILPSYSNPHRNEAQPISNSTPSINDITPHVNAKADIRRGLSLNDRFYFQRELFNNNREAMDTMMVKLNMCDNYQDVEQYIKENTSWDFNAEVVQDFLEIFSKGSNQ